MFLIKMNLTLTLSWLFYFINIFESENFDYHEQDTFFRDHFIRIVLMIYFI